VREAFVGGLFDHVLLSLKTEVAWLEVPEMGTLASRDAIAKTPLPLLLEKIFCLAGFLGETGDSGLNPGLGAMSK
jgi:hypothetical protein